MNEPDEKSLDLTDLVKDHFLVLIGIFMLPSILERIRRPNRVSLLGDLFNDPLKPVLMVILALSGYIYSNHLKMLTDQLQTHSEAFKDVESKFVSTDLYLSEQTKTIMKIQNTQDSMLDKINTLNIRVEKIEDRR